MIYMLEISTWPQMVFILEEKEDEVTNISVFLGGKYIVFQFNLI